MTTRSVHRGLTSWAGLARVVTQLWGALRHRRTVGRLGALDDRMLADIGITRQDVQSVLAEPLLVDPSAVLAHRASETRRGRRAAALDLLIEMDARHPAGAGRRAA